jgi:hypothetical protein
LTIYTLIGQANALEFRTPPTNALTFTVVAVKR